MYEFSDIKFAMCAINVLGIILVVAIAASTRKSRAVFVAGSVGSLLGYVIPEPGICIDGTAEGCFMGYLDWSASHVLLWGTCGAVVAIAAVLAFQALQRAGRVTTQYSLRSLIFVTAATAAAFAIIRFLAV